MNTTYLKNMTGAAQQSEEQNFFIEDHTQVTNMLTT
jgi:hypothetical protein